MALSIKSVFDQHCKNVSVNARWAKDIMSFEQRYLFSKPENLEFLGSPYVGTPKFVFQTHWRETFIYDILKVDDDVSLKDELTDLWIDEKTGKVVNTIDKINNVHTQIIDPSFKVASDIFNLSCMYTVHRLLTSSLPRHQIEGAAIAVLKLMHYRFLSSLMHNYFPYGVKPEIAEATYYALNKRFSIKQHGSWAKLIDERCREVIGPRGIHFMRIKRFDPDITYAITDTQGRIRGVVKKIYPTFMEVHQSKNNIKRDKAMFESAEGEMVIKDTIRRQSQLASYIHDTMGKRESFIKEELVEVIVSVVNSAPERLIREVLHYLVENQGPGGDKLIEGFTDEILLHLFTYLNKQMTSSSSLSKTLKELKALYMSSRSSDASLMQIRATGQIIVTRAAKITNPATVAAVRTAVCMYIVLRTLTMDYYQSTTTGMSAFHRKTFKAA